MKIKVLISNTNGESLKYVCAVRQEGEIVRVVKEAIQEWRKENPDLSLFEAGCSIRIDKA